MGNNEEDILSITLEYIKQKSQIYALSKKVKNARKNGFLFNKIVKSTKRIDSSLAKIIIRYQLNF